jgi:hypothetical protein
MEDTSAFCEQNVDSYNFKHSVTASHASVAPNSEILMAAPICSAVRQEIKSQVGCLHTE